MKISEVTDSTFTDVTLNIRITQPEGRVYKKNLKYPDCKQNHKE